MFCCYILFYKWYGDRVFKSLPFIGPYRCQYGVHYVYDKQCGLYQTCNTQGPDPSVKRKPVTVEMKIESIKVIPISDINKSTIKKVGKKPKEEGDRYYTEYNGIQKKADLKIQCLLSVIVHKCVIFSIGQP